MKVWIGDLAAYNAGTLKGQWFDVSDDTDDNAAMIASVTADEHYIGDFDGFPRALSAKVGEYAGAEALAQCVTLMSAMRSATPDAVDVDDMLDCYLDDAGYGKTLAELIEDAEEWVSDNFLGVFDTLTHWAESYIEDSGMLQDVPELIARYFDYEAFARDAELGGDIRTSRTGSGLLVFSA